MGKHLLSVAAAVAVLLLGGCSGNRQGAGKGCVLSGHTSLSGFEMAYLVDVDRNRLDSMPLTEDGRFTFSVSDSVASAYPLLLQLENPGKPSDELNMPFMVEAGEVRMELGEYVRVWGTPLNSRVQQFLDDLQACADAVMAREGISEREVKEVFSEFYKLQILSNKDNALSSWILHDYGIHLLPADRRQVEAELPNAQEI